MSGACNMKELRVCPTKRRIRIFIVLFFMAVQLSVKADNHCEHTLSIESGCLQIKDSENLGFVFSGPELNTKYNLEKNLDQFQLYYKAMVSGGVLFSHRIIGYSIRFTPVELCAMYKIIDIPAHCMGIGVSAGLRYQWQMYPNLHTSLLFAQSEAPIDLLISYKYRSRGHSFILSLQNSLFGLIGQLPLSGPYYYYLSFSEFAIKPLKEMRFSSFDRYNRSQISLSWSPARLPNQSFGINLNFLRIHSPVSHSLKSLSYSVVCDIKF